MNILIASQYFPPEMGAPQARLHELCIRLKNKGHIITVLTAMPNYPTGKVFPGYRRRLRKTEEIDGIKVIRTWIYPSKSKSVILRMLSSMSFVFSSVLLGLWGCGKQDVMIFESPPLFSVLSAIPIKWLTRSKMLMYVADVWPDIFIRMGKAKKGLSLKLLFWMERRGYAKSDVVALTTPGAQAQINERFPDVTTTILSNGVDTQLFSPENRNDATREQFGVKDDEFLVGYIGLHGVAQGLSVLIDAAEKLKENPKIKVVMVGDGVEKEQLMAIAKKKQLDNILFHDPVRKTQVPGILASCDCSIVPLVVKLPGTMPSKVYEALASGVPPIVAKHCEAENLVTQYNLGRTFEPMDSDELAAAILDLANRPDESETIRANCIKIAKRFDRDALAETVNDVLVAMHEGKDLPEVTW